MRRIVVLSDMQIPFHNQRAVHNVLRFVREYRPDQLACVGDEIDHIETARWSKGGASEYAPTLKRNIAATRDIMGAFRDAIGDDTVFHVQRSNHGDRLEKYVTRYAPALRNLDALRTESLLGYDDLGIVYHRNIYDIAPGWVMAHGDEGSLNSRAGGTALGLAINKLHKSVVCGHTHRLGAVSKSFGYNGRLRTLHGFEVGNLMDIRKAHYNRTGAADWQSGFGILYVDGQKVTPYAVPVQPDGSFIVEGRKYDAR